MTMDRTTMELVYEYHEQLLAATSTAPSPDKEIPLTHRRVQFAANEAIVSDLPSPLLQLDDAWYSDEAINRTLWYTVDELQILKLEARNILFRKGQPGSETDEVRGLERYDYERSRLKRLTNKHLLAAFRESMSNAAFLSLVCQRCTMWARNLAREQGARDELIAQHIAAAFDDEEVFSTIATTTTSTPSCGSKRRMDEAEEERRVRPLVVQS